MNDLLLAVQGGSGLDNGYGEDLEAGPNGEVPTSPKADDMEGFFNQVEAIKSDMHAILAGQRKLQELHEKSKLVTRATDMKKLREEMQQNINAVSKLAHGVKKKLEVLDESNIEARRQEGAGQGSSSERMRTSITAGLKKRLKDCMSEFAELRRKVQQEYREVVERRLFTVTGKHASEEEIDRMIETGEGETVFQKALLDTGRQKALDTLEEIRERQRAVHDLEKSLLELHQIFLDMAILVDAQGEMVDNIEKQVERSAQYMESAVEQLIVARDYQRQTRRLYCCIVLCILIVVLIVILAIVQPWN